MSVRTKHRLKLGRSYVDYTVVRSHSARRLRVRVGPFGVEVIQPSKRAAEDVRRFLGEHQSWIIDQLERAERLRALVKQNRPKPGEMIFRGEPLQLVARKIKARANTISRADGRLELWCGNSSPTSPSRSLENWLRRQARIEIERELSKVAARIRQQPNRVYLMGQRTKWGNCSKHRNLSFNWRLVLAPDFVLRYIVTHEAVHLSIPDHSAKFWLTVQSICKESERAKQWLSVHGHSLLASPLAAAAVEPPPVRRPLRKHQRVEIPSSY